MEGYEKSLKTWQGEGIDQIFYSVTDSAGNKTVKRINVYIVDCSFQKIPSPSVGVRSVRWEYYNMMNKDEDGNLLPGCVDTFNEKSVWVRNPEYVECLTNALNKGRTGQIMREYKMLGITLMRAQVAGSGTWKRIKAQTGEEYETVPTRYTFNVSHEDVEWTKQFIEDHGIGKTKEDGAYDLYYQHFADEGNIFLDEITHRSNVNVDDSPEQRIIPDGWESFAGRSQFNVIADELYGGH